MRSGTVEVAFIKRGADEEIVDAEVGIAMRRELEVRWKISGVSIGSR